MQQKRLLELDGLRAFAILPVLVFHFKPETGPFAFLKPLYDRGWIGVELFFVLSGFLITGILVDSAGKSNYYKNFIVRRALRVLPLYYLYLVLNLVAIQLRPTIAQDVANWGGVRWFSFYCGNIRMAMVGDWPPFRPLTILWSLQVEEQFYLLYPLLIACCRVPVLRKVLLGCVILAPALRCLTLLFLYRGGMTRYVLTPLRMDSLALGGLIALAVRNGRLQEYSRVLLRCSIGGILLCVALFAAYGRTVGDDYNDPLISTIGFSIVDITCATVLAYIVSSPGGKLAAGLKWAPLVYIGQISYGLYLVHYPAGMAVRSVIGRLMPGWETGAVNLLLAAAVSVSIAGLSWRYFESKLLRLKSRFEYQEVEAALRAPAAGH